MAKSTCILEATTKRPPLTTTRMLSHNLRADKYSTNERDIEREERWNINEEEGASLQIRQAQHVREVDDEHPFNDGTTADDADEVDTKKIEREREREKRREIRKSRIRICYRDLH